MRYLKPVKSLKETVNNNESFTFTVHYKNGEVEKVTIKAETYNKALAQLLANSEVDSIDDINYESLNNKEAIKEDISKYSLDELEAEIAKRKQNDTRKNYLNKKVEIDPGEIEPFFNAGDVVELIEDIYYADVDSMFDASEAVSSNINTAEEFLDNKYGLKIETENDGIITSDAMVYFPKGTKLIIDEVHGPSGYTTFKVDGKEALDFSEPFDAIYRGNILNKSSISESIQESFEEDKKYKSIVVRDNASQAEWYFELNNNHELDGDTIKGHAEYCIEGGNGFNVEKFQDLVDCENVTFKKSIEDLAKPIYLFNVKHLRESFEDEHLGETSEEIIPDAVKPGPDSGIAFELNALIQDEWEAIQGYNDAIVTAETEGFHDIAKVLKDIVNEENLHVGQLEQCMKLVSPNADSIDQGEAEASEQLTQNEVNSIN